CSLILHSYKDHFSLRRYIAIVSLEQRQRYKNDLNAEYEEYRNLHSQIDKINKNFRQFHEQCMSLIPGAEDRQVKKDKTVKAVLHHSSVL
ncbi:ELL factor, partial [Copsychus sechellarum]|nr:ELL factor [Copsychus sechellarum]